MHTFPFETPLGFHERYVVENKDRYLEGRYYFDEWDKALHKFVTRTYNPKLADSHKAQFAAVNDQRKQIGSLIARGITPATAEGTDRGPTRNVTVGLPKTSAERGDVSPRPTVAF